MYFVKKITEGKLQKAGDITEFVSKCKDGEYSIEIKKFGTRTSQQNKYLRGVVYKAISEQTGHSPDELHFFFKHKILGLDQDGFPSTKILNPEEFQQFVESVKNIIAEMGYYVPEL